MNKNGTKPPAIDSKPPFFPVHSFESLVCIYILFCGIYTHITKVGNWGLYVIDVPNPPPRGVLLLAIIGDFLSR